jgi:hypothetical protein
VFTQLEVWYPGSKRKEIELEASAQFQQQFSSPRKYKESQDYLLES